MDHLEYHTKHLSHFEELNSIVGLLGSEYKVFIKGVWYFLVAHAVRKKIIRVGDIKVDLRVPLIIFMPSGHGKQLIKSAAAKIARSLKDSVSEPTSYHPEQLIGKTIRYEGRGNRPQRKLGLTSSKKYYEVKPKPMFDQIKGHLADDMVIFDEARDLIEAKTEIYNESNRYLRIALDPIGENLIEKRMVNVPRDQRISYHPKCSILLFSQPYSIPEKVIERGLARRVILLYLPFESKDRTEAFAKKIEGTQKQDLIPKFSNWLGETRKNFKSVSIYFTDMAKEKLKHLHLAILDFAQKFGIKSFNFASIGSYSFLNFLIKISALLAISQGRSKVSDTDVILAYMDFIEFLNSSFLFIERKVDGTLDYGEAWAGAKGKDQVLLNWLFEEKATSLEGSKITIKGYIEKIMEKYGLSKEGARKKYTRHKQKGWISSKQIGKHDSRVWLAFTPRVHQQESKVDWYAAYKNSTTLDILEKDRTDKDCQAEQEKDQFTTLEKNGTGKDFQG